jgi:hypothetical protein
MYKQGKRVKKMKIKQLEQKEGKENRGRKRKIRTREHSRQPDEREAVIKDLERGE